ncbi:MAG TPA: L-2-amino-thiazoline-4-carboxylic acid hydrolase [Bosea sp. (in: a-proteobacteria)]|jgi:hypothetical protein|nr:L-2-amino-thiazoline-4-carboxylic acid hydrolase [Bosea sp. (in: a-proteobacteria)]
MHPYYAERAPAINADFAESLDLARPHFAALIPDEPFGAMREEALDELTRVLPTLPYVGGAQGRMTQYFEQNAGIFALGRVLRRRGVATRTMSQMLRHVFLAKLRERPRGERLAMGTRFLSEASKAMLRTDAVRSQRREDPGDFTYRYVEPPAAGSKPFEFGLDYDECGFCKMSKANGDEDILPMICAMDEESYALRGIALSRTTTLASGERCCNFRYARLDDDQVS